MTAHGAVWRLVSFCLLPCMDPDDRERFVECGDAGTPRSWGNPWGNTTDPVASLDLGLRYPTPNQ
jgi:hypothetical protein